MGPIAFTAHLATKWMNQISTKTVNITSDPFRVILLTAATTGLAGAQDTMATMTDVKAVTGFTELATGVGGSNYTQNANSHLSGLAIAAPTWTESGHVYTFTTATNPVWTTAGAAFNPAYAVFFDDIGGTDATNFVVGWWDFGGVQVGTGSNYSLLVPVAGILTGTCS